MTDDTLIVSHRSFDEKKSDSLTGLNSQRHPAQFRPYCCASWKWCLVLIVIITEDERYSLRSDENGENQSLNQSDDGDKHSGSRDGREKQL